MDNVGTAQVIEWTDHKETVVSPAESGASFCRWLLANVPQHVAASFTASQLEAIESALETRPRSRLPLDIRVSIPFFRRRFFLVFLGGPEKRSLERLKRERVKHALWTFTNICTLVFLVLFIVPALIGMIHMIASAFGTG
jgi:hypothetical protein